MGATAEFLLRGRDQTAGLLRGAKNRLGALAAFATRAFAPVGLALGGFFGARAARGIIDTTDNIGKLAQRLGTTTEFLSEMRFAAKKSGVEFNTFTMALQRSGRRIAQAAGGKGEAQEALKELGFNARALTKLPLEKQFELITQRMDRMADGGRRNALAMQLFDSEGVAVVQMMKDGVVGMRALREESRLLGLSVGKDLAEDTAEFNDNLASLGGAAEGFFRGVLEKSLPQVNEWLADMNKNIQEGPAIIDRVAGAWQEAVKWVNLFKVGLTPAFEMFRSIWGMVKAVGQFGFGALSELAMPSQLGVSGRFSRMREELSRQGGRFSDSLDTGIETSSIIGPALKEAIDRVLVDNVGKDEMVAALRAQTEALERQNERLIEVIGRTSSGRMIAVAR